MRKTKLACLLAALLLCAPALAAEDSFRSDHPQRYEVQRGDTLWDISGRFLRQPWYWPEIWYVNPQIDNPHLIYPGDVIRLVYIDGEPRLTVERGPRTVKLSPRARPEPLDEAIASIPMEDIRAFLTNTMVVDPGVLDAAPYVIAGADERVMSSTGDKLYVRRFEPLGEQRAYAVVRKGDAFVDPQTEEVLGFEAIATGRAELIRSGDPATFVVTDINREILPGDRVLELPEESLQSRFLPHAPEQDLDGRIIAVLDGVTQIGQFSVVVLNRGATHGVEQGHVLNIWEAGRVVRDPYSEVRGDTVVLPPELGGRLVVFRVFDKLSFGLVMEAEQVMNVGDVVTAPE